MYSYAHWILPPEVSFPPYNRTHRSASFYRKQRHPEAPGDGNIRGPKTSPWSHIPSGFRPSKEPRHSNECNIGIINDTILASLEILYNSDT